MPEHKQGRQSGHGGDTGRDTTPAGTPHTQGEVLRAKAAEPICTAPANMPPPEVYV